MSHGDQQKRVLTVDSSVLELAGGNLVLEENVKFSECAVLGLGKSEVAPGVAEEVGASVEETSLGSPVPAWRLSAPLCRTASIEEGLTERRDHSRSDSVLNKTSEVIHESSNNDSLVTETARGSLSNDGVTNRPNGDHVDQVGNHQNDTNSHLGSVTLCEAKATNNEVRKEEKCQTAHVESCSSKVREEEPGDNTADDVASGQRDVEVQRSNLGESCGLKEGDSISDESVATENLSSPDDTVLPRVSHLHKR